MYRVSRHFAAAAVIGLCIIPATGTRADDQDHDKPNRYMITNPRLRFDRRGCGAGHGSPEFLGCRVFSRRQSLLDR